MASAPKESSGTTPAGNAALTAETRDGVVSVAFSGNWKRGETGPDFLASRNEALEKAEKALSDGARALRLEGDRLGDWDSGVIVVTARLVAQARERGVDIDDSRLPEGVRNLTDLALEVPPNTGAQRKKKKASALEKIGGFVLAIPQTGRNVLDFIGEVVLSFGRLFSGRSSCTSTPISAAS